MNLKESIGSSITRAAAAALIPSGNVSRSKWRLSV